MLKWLIPVVILAGIVGVILLSPSTQEPSQHMAEVAPVEETVAPPQADEQPAQPLGQFLNDASLAVVLRYPETITSLGIGPMIGVRDDALMPLSKAYELETMALLESLLEQLDRYNLDVVAPNDALSAQVYGWYLRDLLESYRYAAHGYLITSFINSYPDQLERHLTRSHPCPRARHSRSQRHKAHPQPALLRNRAHSQRKHGRSLCLARRNHHRSISIRQDRCDAPPASC